ncbi:MAG: oxidoreductase [Gracilibacter sp. BRH_c7a]|nr:MAG: oxidoreductase [Gracilibacter sp. BRH_c7a]
MNKLKKRVLISRRQMLKAGAIFSAALATGIIPSKLLFAETSQDAPSNPDKIGFMFNNEKCIGCRSCEYACKNTNEWETGAKWRRVIPVSESDSYLSISCNHCEKPACLTVCPAKAYTIREKDGIVVQDPDKCVGCKYCLYACPYHAPQFSDETGRISKCHFCKDRQDQGEQPACVASCPTKALTYGKLTELRKTPGGVAQIKGLPSPDLTKPSWVIIPKE